MFSSWPAGASLVTDPRPYRERFRAQRRSVTPSYISTFWHITAVAGYNVAIMSKRQISIIGALWIIIFLFLGFPAWLDKIIAVVTGVVMLGLVYSLRIDTTFQTKKASPQATDTRQAPYIEHKSSPEITTPLTTDSVS
jgi:hypothetical protein